jgi:hypothetical protein
MKILHTEKKIMMTKKELKAASVYNSQAYKDLMEVQAKHPTFVIEEVAPQPKKRKASNKGLTYQFMFDCLYKKGDQEGCDYLCKNWAKFNNVAMKDPSSKSYKDIKNWFEDRMANSNNETNTVKEEN